MGTNWHQLDSLPGIGLNDDMLSPCATDCNVTFALVDMNSLHIPLLPGRDVERLLVPDYFAVIPSAQAAQTSSAACEDDKLVKPKSVPNEIVARRGNLGAHNTADQPRWHLLEVVGKVLKLVNVSLNTMYVSLERIAVSLLLEGFGKLLILGDLGEAGGHGAGETLGARPRLLAIADQDPVIRICHDCQPDGIALLGSGLLDHL